MLVLSRKRNERVQIGPDCFVTVVDIRGDRVRLGFEAPANVNIRRTELPPEAIARLRGTQDPA